MTGSLASTGVRRAHVGLKRLLLKQQQQQQQQQQCLSVRTAISRRRWIHSDNYYTNNWDTKKNRSKQAIQTFSSSADYPPTATNAPSPYLQEPMLALAYDYEDDYDDDENDWTTSSSSTTTRLFPSGDTAEFSDDVTGMNFSRTSLGSNRASFSTTTTHNNSSTTTTTTSGGGGGGGGGAGNGTGGGGRYRCPKCGSSVTFRHGDFEENTFYCATCSGWFLIQPTQQQQQQQQQQPPPPPSATADTQIVMQHVSTTRDFLLVKPTVIIFFRLVMFEFFFLTRLFFFLLFDFSPLSFRSPMLRQPRVVDPITPQPHLHHPLTTAIITTTLQTTTTTTQPPHPPQTISWEATIPLPQVPVVYIPHHLRHRSNVYPHPAKFHEAWMNT